MIDYNFAKLINGKPIFVNFPIICSENCIINGAEFKKGTKITTNRKDILAYFGYKPVIRTPEPKTSENYPEKWEETDEGLVQRWEGYESLTTKEELADATAALETLGYIEESEMNAEVNEEVEV